MNKILLGLLLLLFSTSRAMDTLYIPTDFNTVNSGTRANLAGDFTSIGTWAGKIRDTTAQVTSRISGYSGTLLISSLSHLRLKLDADNSETARFIVESGTGDSLFRVSEDSTAKFFKTLTVAGKVLADSASISGLTASQPLWTDAAKKLVSNSPTGTGTTLVLQTSPTIITPSVTGKLTGSDTVAALLGFRAGNTDASNVNLYRLSADMWKTDDSLTVAGSVGVLGLTTLSSDLVFNGTAVGGASRIYKSSADGIGIRGATGSSNDLTLLSASGAAILKNPTGTTQVVFPGAAGVSVTNTLTADSLISSKFYAEGTFTATLTGCTTSPTVTVKYVRIGKQVTMMIPGMSATSNSTSMSYSGLPAGITPSISSSGGSCYGGITDANFDHIGILNVNQSGFLFNFYTSVTASTSAFTNSGIKGFDGCSMSYTLQ